MLGGFPSLTIGIKKQIKVFRERKQDKLGADAKLLGSNIMLIMIGLSNNTLQTIFIIRNIQIFPQNPYMR